VNYVINNTIINLLIDKLTNTKLFVKIIIAFYKALFLFLIVFGLFNIKAVNALEINNDKFIDKIAKDYTNKFCNSMAFGLAKESAMKFANKENNLIFKKKKGFDSLNKDLIANKIAISVVEDCGYLVDLRGEDGINKFREDYISMNNSIS
tara:strand:+ start:31 stop:480 length:450 start_codon:yes stop_codon:yes gene_type:complete